MILKQWTEGPESMRSWPRFVDTVDTSKSLFSLSLPPSSLSVVIFLSHVFLCLSTVKRLCVLFSLQVSEGELNKSTNHSSRIEQLA